MVRPYWSGYLKLSLVTCSVTLAPATTDGEKIRFQTLNRKTNDRVRTRYVGAVSWQNGRRRRPSQSLP